MKKTFKRILSISLLVLFLYCALGAGRYEKEMIKPIEKAEVEVEDISEAVAATEEIAQPKPTEFPEPRFYYSDTIKVPVTKTQQQKIQEQLPLYEIEIEMLSKIIYREAGSSSIPTAQQAAVAWCVLNRLDHGGYGDTIEEIITARHQFAWVSKTDPEKFRWLAEDVIIRWLLEKELGSSFNVGRTLDKEYKFFAGRRGRNYFRKEYKSRTYWDWSLPDPYEYLEENNNG